MIFQNALEEINKFLSLNTRAHTHSKYTKFSPNLVPKMYLQIQIPNKVSPRWLDIKLNINTLYSYINTNSKSSIYKKKLLNSLSKLSLVLKLHLRIAITSDNKTSQHAGQHNIYLKQ